MTESQIFIRLCQVIENYRIYSGLNVLPNGLLNDLVIADQENKLKKYDLDELDQTIATTLLERESLSESKRELLLAELESKFEVSQETGGVIKSKGLVAWDVKAALEQSYFWNSLRQFWHQESPMSDEVINAIDVDTDEILSWCGDPADSHDWARTGLVMGHVQSGKTTNFSALANKAFDVGYNHVIVLAGLTNSLRRQTQERLDETVLGRSSESDKLNRLELGVSRYRRRGADNTEIIALTRETKDFNQLAHDQIDVVEGPGIKILWVVKKNVNVLKSLTKFLSEKLSRNGLKLDIPVLIIDDEADNASVDTKYGGDEPSAINAQIRKLLNCARRYSYVGYTATPFANIFIDPDKNDSDILADELFPRDFIKSLEPADNYIGPHKIFNETHKLYKKCVVNLNNLEALPQYLAFSKFSDHIPESHKSSLTVSSLPASLTDAILLFVAFCAYRITSRTEKKHTSMLVNVSLYNAVQRQVYDHIGSLLRDLKSDVVTLGYGDKWRQSNLLQRMSLVYEQQDMAADLGYQFSEILSSFELAISRIELFLVNMSKDSKELKYPKDEPRGKFVLAIGGLALSRGLTLEGLVVSYIIRNVGAKDTLLQTARWFGYRDGYAEACRVYMPSKLEQRFLETATTVEELRDDLRRMVDLKKTPEEFGLRVRHSGFGLSVTAPTKMGAGLKLVHSADYSARHVQYAEVSLREERIIQNRDAMSSLVTAIDTWELNGEALVTNGQSVDLILKFLGQYSSDHADFSITSTDTQGENTNLICSYISERRDELASWDLIIPFSGTPTSNAQVALSATTAVNELKLSNVLSGSDLEKIQSLFLRQRLSGEIDGDSYKITKNGAVADRVARDIGFALPHDMRTKIKMLPNSKIFSVLMNPALLIHCVQAGRGGNVLDKNPLLTISVCFPGTSIPPIAKTYVANPVYQRQLLASQQIEIEYEEESDHV